jgi:hypothetical protein
LAVSFPSAREYENAEEYLTSGKPFAMRLYNTTFLIIGVVLFFASGFCGLTRLEDRFMYADLLAVVGLVYMILAFKKPKASKS